MRSRLTRTEQARAYVRSRRGEYSVLKAETGYSYDWIAKFGQGAIPNPSASRVDRLLELRDTREHQ